MGRTYDNLDIIPRRVFYAGAAAPRASQLVSFKHDAAVPASGTTRRDDLGFAVDAINANNLKFPAGVVAPSSPAVGVASATGQYVDIYVPRSGDVLPIEVDGTVAVAAGDFLKLDSAKSALIKDAAPAAGVTWGVAMQAQAVAAKVIILVYVI